MAIRNKLEKLTLTQAWSLRETDLWDFQRQLDRIDEARVDGNFFDALGRPSEIYEQRVRHLFSRVHDILTPCTDFALPSKKELFPYLSTALDIRARVGSSTSHLQSADNSAQMSD